MLVNTNEEIYKKIDEERIKQALEKNNWNDVFVLFNYSSLTKEEFIQIQHGHPNYGELEKQFIKFLKEKDTERIVKSLKEEQEKVADYLFTNSDLTEKEYNNLKNKFKETKKVDINLNKGQLNENIWPSILYEISRKISAPSFDTWFKNTKAKFDGDVLKITCCNIFQKEWLEERYNNLISSSAEQIIGKVIDIQVINQDNDEKSSIK